MGGTSFQLLTELTGINTVSLACTAGFQSIGYWVLASIIRDAVRQGTSAN